MITTMGTMDYCAPMDASCTTDVQEWQATLLSERLGALDRTGKRLGRLIDELNELNQDLERLDQCLFVPGLPEDIRQELLAEMDLAVAAYNHLREAAAEAYRQLILQRESCGFRNHEVVRRCYPIPELHELLPEGCEEDPFLPPETY